MGIKSYRPCELDEGAAIFYTRVVLTKIQKGGIFRIFLHFFRILDLPLFMAPSQIEGAFTTAP